MRIAGKKKAAIIEARMTSTRLPGKVLLPALGKPLLLHLVDRLKTVRSIDEIVLATTTNGADDVLIDFAKTADISFFRGSEDNVMLRVKEAAESVAADIIVSITGDCPLIDPNVIEQTIQLFNLNDCDYTTNAHHRCFPDGMDVQVYWLKTLQRSYQMTQDALDQEHVTLHIRQHPDVFKHCHLPAPQDCHWPELGLTLDEPADYQLISSILVGLYPSNPIFGCQDILRFLKLHPDLLRLNSHVQRKGDT